MKRNVKQPALLLVYGEGGHAEEMRRLLQAMPELFDSGLKMVAITEPRVKTFADIERFACPEVRGKQDGIKLISFLKSILFICRTTFQLLSNYDIRFLLTTGPGLAIPVALLARWKNVQVLHVETCCRFYSKSLTGKFMEKIAHEIWVQNEELLKIYPEAKWCGRL